MAKSAKIDELAPTQMTLGMYFVRLNAADFGKLGKKDLKRLIDERTVPAVRGPGKRYWMIDRHHYCRALHEIGADKVEVETIADASHLGIEEFAHFMEKAGYIHPYDAAGRRCGFDSLPSAIDGLVDDPYRTLAGLVRESGGFRKEKRPYAEFLWADFYRNRIDQALLTGNFTGILDHAEKLAASKAARHLPGWK